MTARLIDVTRRFGHVLAVDGVSFSIGSGEVVGLLGANGAGKTTCIRMLLGLISPTGGEVELFGVPPALHVLRRVGYVPQGLGLYTDLTPGENMRFKCGVFGVAVPSPPEPLSLWWSVPVSQIPLGVRRRVAFEVALAHRPEMLILDEPTSGVGPLGRARLWERIHAEAEAGASVLVTTHHVEEAEQCDRLVMLAAGRVVATGAVDEIVGSRTVIEVVAPHWRRALRLLEEAGEPVILAGTRLRVPGGEPDRIRALLDDGGVEARLDRTPASLDETFAEIASG